METLEVGDAGSLATLAEGQVRVFCVRVPEDDEPGRSERLCALLSDEERARQLRFHFAHDRRSYLFAHALTRTLLSSTLGVQARELYFEPGEHGRPELTFPAREPKLRFNLSHTRGMVACAVAFELDVGVDVEQVTRRLELPQLARQVFSAAERDALFELEEGAQRERFFRLWTLKEAYIKAVGKGLAIPLRSISFQLAADSHPRVEFAPPVEDAAEHWWFRTWQPASSHMLSIAVRTTAPIEVAVAELRL